MRMRNLCRIFAGLAAGLLVAQGAAAQPYFGLGIASLSLSTDYAPIGEQSGTGFVLIGGYEFASTWSFELSVSATDIDTGPTIGIYYPADSAEYSILRISLRKSLWSLVEKRWTPWLAIGGAYHYASWNTFYYQLDGTGASFGAGVDFALAPSWSVRVQAMRNRFSASDTYGEGSYSSTTDELSASVIYTLR
jgi:outer membrane protein W